MRLTETERAELKSLARATDDGSLDRFCELLAKEALPDGKHVSAAVLREAAKEPRSGPNAALLRESVKRAFPGWAGAQVDTFLKGSGGVDDLREADSPDYWPDHIEDLAAAVKSLHPDLSDTEVAQWVKKNEKRALDAKKVGAGKSAKSIVMALDGEDKDAAAAQWLPEGLKKIHPSWSQSQIDGWLKKYEELARSFKGMHPDWDAAAVIRAADPRENK